MNRRFSGILGMAAWILLPSFLAAAASVTLYSELLAPVHPPFTADPLGTAYLAAFWKALILLWIPAAGGIALAMFLSSRIRKRPARRTSPGEAGSGLRAHGPPPSDNAERGLDVDQEARRSPGQDRRKLSWRPQR